jgi:hypothetical protein
MTAIEILATIFSVLILVKLITYIIAPRPVMNFAEKLLKKKLWVSIIYFTLAIIVGYYVLCSLSIVQVAAVMLFTSMLIGLSLIPYTDLWSEIVDRMALTSRAEMFKKNWLILLIWVMIAVWTLFEVIT